MTPRAIGIPEDPGPGPGGFYDAARLAKRLGITVSALRNARLRGVSWLPAPDGTLNNGPVWHKRRLEDIESKVTPAGRPRV